MFVDNAAQTKGFRCILANVQVSTNFRASRRGLSLSTFAARNDPPQFPPRKRLLGFRREEGGGGAGAEASAPDPIWGFVYAADRQRMRNGMATLNSLVVAPLALFLDALKIVREGEDAQWSWRKRPGCFLAAHPL